MLRAVGLAVRGWGRTAPNPMVGCVLTQGDRVVGEGWHRGAGLPHAEIEALAAAGPEARGATAWVTLEPCAHYGRTPPCTNALIAAGVSEVVFAASDPGEGQGGGAVLRDAGLRVRGPLLPPEEARHWNGAFDARIRDRSWVVLKMAVSLDGGIAAAPGVQTAISGPEARAWVHRLRAGFDAIAIGSATARVDDPLLTVRDVPGGAKPPARVVFDSGLRIDPGARLLHSGPGPVVIVGTETADPVRAGVLRDQGARVILLPASDGGRVDLDRGLRELSRLGLRSILVEGGGRLAAGFLSIGRVDRVVLVQAPRFLGPGRVPAFPSEAPGPLSPEGGAARSPAWRWCGSAALGADLCSVWETHGDQGIPPARENLG